MASLTNGTTGHLEPEEIKIPVPWGHISGKWWGSRKVQPILALHGWQDNAGTWDALAPLLPPSLGLLALDMMGHGHSSHYPKGQYYYLYWDGVMMIQRVCQHFGWEQVTLLGHSLGGSVSFLYAASFPQKVQKLMCIDIAGPVIRADEKIVNDTGTIITRLLDYESKPEKSIPTYQYDDVVDIVMDAYRGSLTRESCKILLKRGTKATMDRKGLHFSRDVRLKIAGLGSIAHSTVIQFAGKISCEVLNIKGKPGMVFDNEKYYYEVIDTIRKSAKRFEFYEVEGTHHLHLNNPERIVHLITSFLQDYDDTDLPV